MNNVQTAPKWEQELLWVKRDANGAIVGISETPPKKEDFIPNVSPLDKK
jgi:hypothetical protein